jgi:hypothetical protein
MEDGLLLEYDDRYLELAFEVRLHACVLPVGLVC